MRLPEPAVAGEWILIGFAGAIVVLDLCKVDSLDALFFGLVCLPWLVGPAAVAARYAKRSGARRVSWAFIAIEIAVVCSTAALWIDMFVHPDAQNGIAMMFFLVLQLGAVLAAALAIKIVSLARRHAAESNISR